MISKIFYNHPISSPWRHDVTLDGVISTHGNVRQSGGPSYVPPPPEQISSPLSRIFFCIYISANSHWSPQKDHKCYRLWSIYMQEIMFVYRYISEKGRKIIEQNFLCTRQWFRKNDLVNWRVQEMYWLTCKRKKKEAGG